MEQRCVVSGENLAVGYRAGTADERRVHEGLSFGLRSGELTCLMGPNGAGKSTLLRTLGGSQPSLAGKLSLGDRPLAALGERRLSRRVGVVLTDRIHAGGLRVRELVALGRYPYTGFFGRLDRNDRQIVDESMREAGIETKAECYLSELSDGERQKAMIAKVLAQQCPIILLDEPSAFLDVASRIEVMHLLHDLARKRGKAVLMSTHDVGLALQLADRLWLLSREGLCCGAPEDRIADGSLDRVFGRNGIVFDSRTGDFRREASSAEAVRVTACRAELAFWTENLLRRCGLRPASEEETARQSVEVRSCRDMEWQREGSPAVHCTSFGELADALAEKRYG